MSDLQKKIKQWQDKLINVKSEEEARTVIEEIIPSLDEIKEMFSRKDLIVNDREIDWVGGIHEYIVETVKLYLSYHVRGHLERVHLLLSERKSPIIMINIDGQSYQIDFEEIKNGTDEKNRDAHRECYYRNESIWYEFRRSNNPNDLKDVGDALCRLMESTFPSVIIDYVIVD